MIVDDAVRRRSAPSSPRNRHLGGGDVDGEVRARRDHERDVGLGTAAEPTARGADGDRVPELGDVELLRVACVEQDLDPAGVADGDLHGPGGEIDVDAGQLADGEVLLPATHSSNGSVILRPDLAPLLAPRPSASTTQALTDSPARSAAFSTSSFSDGGRRSVRRETKSSPSERGFDAGGLGDPQRGIAVDHDDVDVVPWQLGADLGRGLLGELHRGQAQCRAERLDDLADRGGDGGIGSGQGCLVRQRGSDRVDDGEDVHDRRSRRTRVRPVVRSAAHSGRASRRSHSWRRYHCSRHCCAVHVHVVLLVASSRSLALASAGDAWSDINMMS